MFSSPAAQLCSARTFSPLSAYNCSSPPRARWGPEEEGQSRWGGWRQDAKEESAEAERRGRRRQRLQEACRAAGRMRVSAQKRSAVIRYFCARIERKHKYHRKPRALLCIFRASIYYSLIIDIWRKRCLKASTESSLPFHAHGPLLRCCTLSTNGRCSCSTAAGRAEVKARYTNRSPLRISRWRRTGALCKFYRRL